MSDRHEITELLARYGQALEERDGEALAELFAPDGEFQIFSRHGRDEYIAHGADVIGRATIRAMMQNSSLPAGRGMHYLTTDHIVEITGDTARMRAQFVVVESNADARPEPDNGWPFGFNMVHGGLALTMIGRYDSHLLRTEDGWVFTLHQVKHNLPMTLPPKK
ncbi:nuclear transport factor 2 family protein [Streptomyces sp. NPDC005181]|uniref:nuclear transport factor 2 family protein n=1 Tax=Streptomyces sp. NPDC005181 TaxID=3156869 RepID=UPI0033AF263F